MMAKKWADPLDRLLKADEKARSIKDYLNATLPSENNNSTLLKTEHVVATNHLVSILEVDVKDIIRWKHKDRPENELGDIQELAKTFTSVGQQQPCILRLSKEHPGKYELI